MKKFNFLKAMSASKVIIFNRTYDKFVKNNYTYLLLRDLNLEKLVDWLVNISNKRNVLSRYGRNSINVISKLNNSKRNAYKLKSFSLNTYNEYLKE